MLSVNEEAKLSTAVRAAGKIIPKRPANKAPIIPSGYVEKLLDAQYSYDQFEWSSFTYGHQLSLVRSMLLIGLACAFRGGELLKLRKDDVVKGDMCTIVSLVKTKTEPLATVKIVCSCAFLENKFCVACVLSNLAERTPVSARLFHVVKDAKQFIKLSRDLLGRIGNGIDQRVVVKSIESYFTMHSMRRTGASVLVHESVDIPTIKSLCRWKTDNMPETYAREVLKDKAATLPSLVLSKATSK